ncbi:hypothetical protein BO70DRAFT_393887 [Aspergillus heteromorphus CBS 117.55]|uniref:Heterokaryon incompatibility domain-containing protein n=1 Tax=Aspergillus heteromorphus CBS 117.55 TaxID=1448321 RepID=A0A317WNV8_9EURO|nr:uncharacterized protein BO70DRAFT_393887 [Aspergillus heteromorphus CBS 117.55]PWY88164.1 hypothetical protein BO70DRAFT_393887 [Aspergillus heteromorphus CBS 117.55]
MARIPHVLGGLSFPDEWTIAMLGVCQMDYIAVSSKLDYQRFASDIHSLLPKASELRSSAVSCALCAFIFRNVSQFPPLSPQVSQGLLGTADAPIEIKVWRGLLQPGQFRIHSCLIKIDDEERFRATCWLFTNWEDADGRSGQVFSNPPAPPGSVASLAWLQKQLHHCLSNHEECKKGIAGEDCDVIHLVESGGPQAVYNALSYCWGPPDQRLLRTTDNNLQQHKEEIAMESLAKTYRHAIEVTRRLGIRYMWIDALCIIQGNGSDWEHECELMGQYYQYSERAHPVIAASGADSPAKGCFSPSPKLG